MNEAKAANVMTHTRTHTEPNAFKRNRKRERKGKMKEMFLIIKKRQIIEP